MLNIYFLSTSLHLFQAEKISRRTENNIFILDVRCEALASYKNYQGKVFYTEFNCNYFVTVLRSIFVRRKDKPANFFVGNQNNSIFSVVANKYSIKKIFFLDDGLASYGFQSEKIQPVKSLIKKTFSYFLNLFSVKVFLVGVGQGFWCLGHRSIEFKFISLIGDIRLIEDIFEKRGFFLPRTHFLVDYFEEQDKGKKSNSGEYIEFLSFSDSKEYSKMKGMDEMKILHPRFRPKGKMFFEGEIVENWIKDKYIIVGVSSLLLVKYFVYESCDFEFVGSSDEVDMIKNVFNIKQ